MNEDIILHVFDLQHKLDSLREPDQKDMEIRKCIQIMVAQGMSKEEILDVFNSEFVGVQSSDVFDANNSDFRERLLKILNEQEEESEKDKNE